MTHANAPLLRRSSTAFLQGVIVLVGVGAIAFLLWEPHVEGVNRNATLAQKYINPFVLYVYIASVPCFVGLYQGIKVLGYAGRNKVISQEGVNALRRIKYCALAVIAFVAVSVLFMIGGDPEDRPAGTFMRILVGFPSVIVAAAAAMFERVLQNAVDLKSENDLTV
jgi:cytochrome bd-type quinol oxidase subunit 2